MVYKYCASMEDWCCNALCSHKKCTVNINTILCLFWVYKTAQQVKNSINSNNTPQHIFRTAFSNTELISSNITNDKIYFRLNATDFCYNISESKQSPLIEIFQKLISTMFECTHPPTSQHDLQCFNLSTEHSIYKNISCHLVTEVDSHSHV